jgi:protein TonB
MVRTAAAVLIFAATGLGVSAYWLNFQGLTIPDRAQQAPVAPTAAVAERASTSPNPRPAAKAPTKAGEIAAARERAIPAKTTGAPKAKPAASSGARPRVPPKPDRQPTVPTPQVASVLAPAGVTAAPAHEAAPPPPVAAALPPPASAAPLLPFFEMKEVNESPRVASRVEPQLPDDLQAHELNDVVVVRLLVSQSGHPSSFSLLRRSKAGPSLDDAVVAAVKQWTFSPARKKGEAVSCWFNVGVPVRRAH